MFVYLYEELLRLESYFEARCAYTSTPWHQTLVALSKMPLLGLSIAGFLTIYQRSVAHDTLGFSLLLTGLCTAVLAQVEAPWVEDPTCAHRVVGRPSDAAAVLACIWTWWVALELRRRCDRAPLRTLTFTALIVLSLHAQVALHLYTVLEVVTGVVLGCAASIVAHWLTHQHKTARWLAAWLACHEPSE